MKTCLNCNVRSNCRQYEVEGETGACIEYIPQNLQEVDVYSLLADVRAVLMAGIESEENGRHDECLVHINMALVKINKIIEHFR